MAAFVRAFLFTRTTARACDTVNARLPLDERKNGAWQMPRLLDVGEAAALSLAQMIGARLILLDERKARRIAARILMWIRRGYLFQGSGTL